MGTPLSPGVVINEKDFSGIVPNVASGIGGIVGRFTRGPVNTPILVSSETDLVNIFGKPTETNAMEWFTAAQFLQYSNKLWAVRAKPASASNAYVETGSVTGTVSFGNDSEYEDGQSGIDTDVKFVARELGAFGNQLGLIVVDNGNWSSFKTWADDLVTSGHMSQSFASVLQYQPGTSNYVETYAGASKNDEIHVIIFDATGAYTGTKYQVLEVYQGLSKAIDALDYQGNPIYYVSALQIKSKYLWTNGKLGTSANGTTTLDCGSTTFQVAGSGVSFAPFNFTFQNVAAVGTGAFAAIFHTGVDGTAAAETDVATSYDVFLNTDLYDVNLLPTAGYFNVATLQKIINVAYTRKDAVAFFSPSVTATGVIITDSSATAVNDIIAFFDALNIAEMYASYGFCDSGYKYIYDKYNNKYRWVPLNGDTAGLCAQVDQIADAWYSPGGFTRGGIKNVIKLAFNPNQAQRDILYPKSINPVVAFPGQGVVLYGDKTMTRKPSAFDRIGVRRLFIVLEKAISIAAKYTLFEFNDSFTRAQFRNMVEPFLRNIQGRRGINEFLVICDESNNTPYVIDANQFVGSIYVKPNKSINFITLNFVAASQSVDFSVITGQG